MSRIRLVHLADIHLGYRGNTNLLIPDGRHAGRYVREVDIEIALIQLTKDIISADPKVDVVVFAGDLFHKSAPLPRAIQRATEVVHRLRINEIEVVIIDGNHETSSWRHTGSPTTFLKELGAHVVNGTNYKVVQDDMWSNKNLRGMLAVHALPYRAVLENEFTGVRPLDSRLNVLLAHGRVAGMPKLNSLGRVSSANIPSEVIRRRWDYIALGDWHIHRYQPLLDVPAYYSGSIEALNFKEAIRYPLRQSDPHQIRGVLDVKLSLGEVADVSTLENVGKRPVFKLDSIDASDLTAEALTSEILSALVIDKLSKESLVHLEVENCPPHIWAQLDHAQIDLIRQNYFQCHIVPQFLHLGTRQSAEAASEATLDEQWADFLEEKIPDSEERAWFLQQGKQLIDSARKQAQSVDS